MKAFKGTYFSFAVVPQLQCAKKPKNRRFSKQLIVVLCCHLLVKTEHCRSKLFHQIYFYSAKIKASHFKVLYTVRKRAPNDKVTPCECARETEKQTTQQQENKHSLIQCSSQDVFPIGGKLHK